MKVSTIKRVVMRAHGGEGAARNRNMEYRLNMLAAVSGAHSQTYGPACGVMRSSVNMERACMQMHVQIRALCIYQTGECSARTLHAI